VAVPTNLEALRKELAEIKAKQNQLIGKRDTLLDRLRSEFGLSSIAEAEAKAVEMDADIRAKQQEYILLKQEFERDGN
jgi:hypothetical protein